MSNIIGTVWFTNSQGTTGIVRAETDDGIRYFIGRAVIGTEEEDTQYIAEYGSTFPTPAGDTLFGIRGEPVGYITKEMNGVMPWVKLNSQEAGKVEIGRHPVYL